ncbi:MAG: AraC family transcriptional regulator [Spirulina sp. SIO3F2]|nr:AraC family transcriptional regulator [Spirulina sp. SIO3F2]
MTGSLSTIAFLIHTRIQIARTCGIDVETVLQRAGVTESFLRQPLARVSLEQDNAIWRGLVAVTGDAAIGLKLGQYFQLPGFGIVGYILMNTKTVAQGMKLFAHYKPLLTNVCITELHQTPEHLLLTERLVGRWQPELRCMFDFIAASMVSIHRNLGKNRGVPQLTQIQFPFPEPEDLSPYQTILGEVPLAFNADALHVHFAGDFNEVAVLGSSPEMLAAFEQQAQGLMTRYSNSNLSDRVRQEILQYLRCETPTLRDIAQQLTMSVRSLQQKLKAENTSFKVLLDEVRRDLAIEYLEAGQLNKSEIACLLGFSEVSAFSRVFKRWTGRSPSDYQKQK